ncbi:MAG: type II toxin-antitoxin system VapC family toxin [Rhodospirillales bacterium]
MTLVIDASVCMHWFSSEPENIAALRLLDGNETLVAPDLVVPEVCSAVWKAVHARVLVEKQAETIVSRFVSAFSSIFPNGPLRDRAFAIACALDHPVCDCFYIALAEQQDARMVTADERLVRRVQKTAWQAKVVLLTEFAER